jgi:hypothetical protein
MARPASNSWTEAQVVAALRRCAREIKGKDKRPLSVNDYRRWSATQTGVPKMHTVYELFESWPKACRAAGIQLTNNPNTPNVSMTEIDTAMKAAVKEHKRLYGDAPMRERDYEEMIGVVKGVDVSLAGILRACGRWSEAGVKYGFHTGRVRSIKERPQKEWAKEVVAICRRAGRPLWVRQFDAERPSGFPTARRLTTAFGVSWDSFLINGGYNWKQINEVRHKDRLAVAARRKENAQMLQLVA